MVLSALAHSQIAAMTIDLAQLGLKELTDLQKQVAQEIPRGGTQGAKSCNIANRLLTVTDSQAHRAKLRRY